MSIFSSQVVKDTHEHFTARRRASCVRRAAEASEMRERGAQNEAHRNPRRVSRQPEEATGTGKCVRGVHDSVPHYLTRRFHGSGNKPLGQAKCVRGVHDSVPH